MRLYADDTPRTSSAASPFESVTTPLSIILDLLQRPVSATAGATLALQRGEDPLVAARIAAIQQRGGHPFNEYQVPLATLTLLQGLGRLIRSRSDRGVLAVLDPRLTRMAYGRRFLSSLPPAPITTDLGAVAAFLRRDS